MFIIYSYLSQQLAARTQEQCREKSRKKKPQLFEGFDNWMIWNAKVFKQAHADLVTAVAQGDISFIESVLEPIKNDLQQLLSSPPKSEASRSKLSQKVVEIDGEEIDLNNAFLNDAARVADELNLDELVAAQLAYYSMGDAYRLGVSIYESALTLYYARRQYIIDIIRFSLESLPTDKFGLVIGEPTTRLNNILDALKAVERNMHDLKDKAKTAEFMGHDKSSEFSRVLKMHNICLIKEHEALGNVLYAYLYSCAASENNVDIVIRLLKHLATFEALDSRMLAYFMPLVVWFSAKHSEDFTIALWSYFTTSSTQDWKLSYWQAGLSLVFLTSLADEERALPAIINFGDILDAAKRAVDASGLEFWLAITQDVNSQLGEAHFDKYRPLVRSRVPEIMFWQPISSNITQENYQSVIEILFTAFISNLADVLKEMRLNEEDMYLALNELEGNLQPVSPGVDLERFFLFVAIACRDHPEISKKFLDDDGGALQGFLLWAADCQVTFMSATFAELLASLASDKTSCAAIHKFLIHGIKQSNQNEDGFILAWSSMYDVLEYYVRGATSSQQSNKNSLESSSAEVAANFAVPGIVSVIGSNNVSNLGHSQAEPGQMYNQNIKDSSLPTALQNVSSMNSQDYPYSSSVQWGMADNVASSVVYPSQQPSKLSDDTLIILSAYLTLISRVCSQSNDACEYIQDKRSPKDEAEPRNIVTLLFKLLKLRQPIICSIFNVLIPFASADLWPLLDNFILGKFEESLLSIEDALAFVKLVGTLTAQETLSPRIGEYIDFILTVILPWTTAYKDNYPHEKNIYVLLQLSCLEFLKVLLTKTPYNDKAFKVCFNENVYRAISQILSTGIDVINELGTNHPLVKSVTRSVEVVLLLIEFSVVPSWSFDKPVLYHLQIVPHLALYAGSLHRELSLFSINLLSLLDETPEFRPTVNRQSRILSILSSTSESIRIRAGLMARLDDEGTDLSVKIAILQMIVRQLRLSGSPRHSMTVAHYLLGFKQSELGLELKLELDSGVGGISSGSSLLSAVCNSLLAGLCDVKKEKRTFIRLCSEVLWCLVKGPLSSDMVLDHLRQCDFWLDTIRAESKNIDSSVAASYKILEHRAYMLDIWISEVGLCQKRLLLTIESHYIDALVPIVFSLVNFAEDISEINVAFKCLKAWCRLIPVLIASGDAKTGPTFVSRIMQTLVEILPVYSRNNAEFAVPIASLLMYLFEQYQQQGIDDYVARHMRYLFESALVSIQPSQVNTELRNFLYTICFQNMKLVLQTGSKETQMGTLRALNGCGPRIFHIACDDALGYANESLRTGALLFIQTSTILSGRLGSEIIAEILLQYNFVSIFIHQILCPSLTATSNIKSKAIFKNTGDELQSSTNKSTTPTSSVLVKENGIKPSSVSTVYPGVLMVNAMKCDEIQPNQIAKISLSLLLSIAQTRAGAANILNSDLLKRLDAEIVNLPDDVLFLVLQLLIAVVVSLGAENEQVLTKIRYLLERHKPFVESILRRNTSFNHTLQDQTVESEVLNLARNYTILMSLTGTAS